MTRWDDIREGDRITVTFPYGRPFRMIVRMVEPYGSDAAVVTGRKLRLDGSASTRRGSAEYSAAVRRSYITKG